MPARDYDVVLYGASGFTGRQTVQYFAEHAERARVRWAMAGRDRERLEAVKARIGAAAHAAVLVADSHDQGAVDAVVSRTRVVLNTAGPFALYGGRIVDACVRYKTHYVDITGETPWVKDLIDRYHEQAAADGTRIIPFCGFDAVPSDLGVYVVVGHLRRELGLGCGHAKAFFQARGGLNGGTLASVINLHESRQSTRMQEPYLLNPPESIPSEDNKCNHDHERVRYDADIGAWVGPFFMGPVNTRVVRRSAALYELRGEGYGRRFAYQEYLRYDKPFARAKAYGYTAALALASGAIGRPTTRRFMMPLLPAPGSGPSQRSMDEGWFSCEVRATAEDGRKARCHVRDRGDPANRVTVKCVCESALGLALNEDILPGGPTRGGVLTPATGLGEVLAARLRKAGMAIEVSAH